VAPDRRNGLVVASRTRGLERGDRSGQVCHRGTVRAHRSGGDVRSGASRGPSCERSTPTTSSSALGRWAWRSRTRSSTTPTSTSRSSTAGMPPVGTGRTRTRSSASTRPPVLRRRVDRARERRDPASRAGGRAARAGRTGGDPALLRRRHAAPAPPLGAGHLPVRERVPNGRHRPPGHLTAVGRAGGGDPSPSGRRCRLPRSVDPGDVPAAVRCRRRRPRRHGQRAGIGGGRPEPVRDRWLGQDGHRRDRVAADQRGRPRAPRLGPAA
jgi:hypothetical protein